MRKNIQKILLGMMLILIGYLIVANVNHILALQVGDTVTYQDSSYEDDTLLKEIKRNATILNSNVEKLSNLNSTTHLNEKQFSEIKKSLEEANKIVQDSSFLKLQGEVKYTNVELYKMIMEYSELQQMPIISSFNTIIETDETVEFTKDEITTHYLEIIYGLSNVNEKLINDYQYYTVSDTVNHALLVEVKAIQSSELGKIRMLVSLSDYLVKDGGIHE